MADRRKGAWKDGLTWSHAHSYGDLLTLLCRDAKFFDRGLNSREDRSQHVEKSRQAEQPQAGKEGLGIIAGARGIQIAGSSCSSRRWSRST
jgi:hypothetical protein